MNVRVRRLPHAEGLPLPARQTAGSAGYDVSSAEEFTLAPGERKAVATGLTFELPDGLADILNSVALSTARGIMFSEFKGTLLHHAFLPIVDVKSLNREEIKK